MPTKTKAAMTTAMSRFEEGFAKTYGKDALDTGQGKVPDYGVISTGSLALDYELGVGGIVEGRLTEFWGPDGLGKTRLGILHLVEAQKKYPNKKVAFVDVEHKFDWNWAIKHGLNRKMTYLFPPDNAEDVADAVKDFIRSGIVSAIVVDSIGAMIPEAEKEKDADAVVMAQQAKIVTRMVKIASAEAPKYGVSVVLLNQVRASLAKFGADTTTGGGFALKHVTSFKFKVKKTGTPPFKAKVGDQEVIVGHELAVYVERNAVAPAYRTATLVFFNVETAKYGPVGLDKVDEAVTMGLKTKVIKQRGAWYDLPDGSSHQGKDKVLDYLRDTPAAVEQIRKGVLDIAAGRVLLEESAPEDIPEVEDPEDAINPRFRGVDELGEGEIPVGEEA